MKISTADFESMKAKYDKEVKKGKAAKGNQGKDKDDQTSWVFFDRATLESLLEQTDPKTGGIKFHLVEYTKETAEKIYPNEAKEYEGQITLVMEPTNMSGNSLKSAEDGGGNYYNKGTQCPYRCE